MARRAALMLLSVLAPLLVLAVAGCEDDCTTEPPPTTGQIEGRITALGIPVEASLIAYRLGDTTGDLCGCLEMTASTDSAGSYQIPVVPGKYVLRVSARTPMGGVSGFLAHGTLARTDADTLEIGWGNPPVRADLRLGVARIELSVPSAFEDGTAYASLIGEGELSGHYIQAVAHPANGLAAFYFPIVPQGRYRMQLRTPIAEFWLPGSYTESGGELLDVGLESETIYQDALSELATLRGTITGSWQEFHTLPPLLRIFSPDSVVIGRTSADANGAFALVAFAPTRVRLHITIDGVSRWEGGPNYDTATEFDLAAGHETTVTIVESGIGGELGRGKRATLIGSVSLHAGDGTPIGTAGVQGTSNMFFFPNLLPGTYYIKIPRGSTWIEQWYDHAVSLDAATPIVVGNGGQVVWIYPELMEGGGISGIVLDEQGSPVIGATILLTDVESPRILSDRRAITRIEGAFDLIALPDGAYKIGADIYGRGVVWYPGTDSWDSAGVVTIESHEDVTGILIEFPR